MKTDISSAICCRSQLQVASLRLVPGADLKLTLLRFVREKKWKAVCIVTCVGSLRAVNIRLAGYRKGDVVNNGESQFWYDDSQNFEIVSLVGTLESSTISKVEEDNKLQKNSDIDFPDVYGHIHISIADSKGLVRGGHLMSGCIVYTTAEVMLMETDTMQFSRRPCNMSGYDELYITSREVVSSIDDIIKMITHLIKICFHIFIIIPFRWISSPLTSKY
mmetsp:Transcript_28089/g.40016  ORF Transcript_28089/g.40016 Transcript_28089/m.40016 type:complete len:219 (-) Transcript_28089:2-658(-)